jgi:hypothetical protein
VTAIHDLHQARRKEAAGELPEDFGGGKRRLSFRKKSVTSWTQSLIV